MMKPYEMVQEFVKDKLMTDDTKFEVTKLVEAIIAYERDRCVKIAERHPGGWECGCKFEIAKEIREGK